MIPFFDHFVDTREKRYHLLLIMLLTCAFCILIPYLFLGVKLLQLNNYDSLYALLGAPCIEWTYVSRVIVDILSLANHSIENFFECLLSNIQAGEILLFLLLLFCYGILEKKKLAALCVLLIQAEIIGCSLFANIALHSGSLLPVITNMRRMGLLIVSMDGLVCVILLFHIIKQFRYYLQVVAYKVEEIKEHNV